MKRKRIVTGLLSISMESFAKRMGWSSYIVTVFCFILPFSSAGISSYIVTKDKCGTVGIQKG